MPTLELAQAEVSVELVRTPAARALGLQRRIRLPWNHGMLFAFPREAQHAFTMTNTYIPLDMIFFSAAGFVVGIVRNAAPMTRGPYEVSAPSQYVLEVNAGWVAQNRVKPGLRMQFAP